MPEPIETPCTDVCRVEGDVCIGCARTVEEIAAWGAMSVAERRTVMAALPARRAGKEPKPARYAAEVAEARAAGDAGRLAHRLRHLVEALSAVGRAREAAPLGAELAALADALPDMAPLERANLTRALAVHAETMGDVVNAVRLWREAGERYRALDALFLELTGKAENPGSAEAVSRLRALNAD